MRDQRKITAYHEAGRVVAALACGLVVRSVSIKPDSTSRGRTRIDNPGGERSRERLAIAYLGGIGGDHVGLEEEGRKDDHAPSAGDHADRALAEPILAEMGHAEDMDAYAGMANRLVSRDRNRKAIVRIANELLRAEELGREKVAELAGDLETPDAAFWHLLDRVILNLREKPPADPTGG